MPARHPHPHAFPAFRPLAREGLTLATRRNLLKAGLAGFGGLTLPALLPARDRRTAPPARRASSCCGWPAGRARSTRSTPSPTARRRTAGRSASRRRSSPASSSASTCRSSRRCSTGSPSSAPSICRHSNHEPNTVMQTANLLAEPRTNPEARSYPAIASLVAKFRGANHPAVPAVRRVHAVAVAPRVRRVPRQAVRPVPRQRGGQAAGLRPRRQGHRAALRREDVRAAGRRVRRTGMGDRQSLLKNFDRLRADIDSSGSMAGAGQVRAAGGGDADRRAGAGRPRPRRRSRRDPRPVRQAPVVSAGAARPPAGGSRAPRSSRST